MISPFDAKSFSLLESPMEKCVFLWNHYLSRKRNDDLEPIWTLRPYALIKKFIDVKEASENSFDEKELFILNETIKSHTQPDGTEVPVRTGFPNEGSRIMHDCWKAGSFTWLFMGRSESKDIFVHKNFVVISRTLPDHLYDILDKDFAPQTLFAAYDRLDDNKNVGPAICVDDLLQELEENYNA